MERRFHLDFLKPVIITQHLSITCTDIELPRTSVCWPNTQKLNADKQSLVSSSLTPDALFREIGPRRAVRGISTQIFILHQSFMQIVHLSYKVVLQRLPAINQSRRAKQQWNRKPIIARETTLCFYICLWSFIFDFSFFCLLSYDCTINKDIFSPGGFEFDISS